MSDPDNCEPVAVPQSALRISKMAEFGEQVMELMKDRADSLDDDTCFEVMGIALELGLVKKIAYDPEIHGEEDEFALNPGDEIWWWGGRNL